MSSASSAKELNEAEEPTAKKSKSIEKDESSPFSSPWHFSDVVLLVEGRKFHVHKSTLSMWSPVFERMFTSEFKEKSSPEIELPGKSAKEIEVLLKLICFKDKHKSVNVNDDNFEFLLELSDEYQMDQVKEYCADYMKSTLHKDNCLHFCQIADLYRLEVVKSKCVESAKTLILRKIEKSQDFERMNPETKYEILSKRIKALENALFSLNSNWHQGSTSMFTIRTEEQNRTVFEELMQNYCTSMFGPSTFSSIPKSLF